MFILSLGPFSPYAALPFLPHGTEFVSRGALLSRTHTSHMAHTLFSLCIIEIFFCLLEFQAPSGLVQLFISARDATLNRGGRGGGLLEEVRELRGYYAELYDEGRLEGG